MIVEVLLKRLFQVVVDATKSDFELRPDEMPGGKDRNSVDFGDTSNDNIPTNRRLSKSLGRAPSNRSLGSIKLPGSVPESIRFLHNHFSKTIDGPYTFDQLRTLDQLKTLIERLRVIDESYLIFALLWCKLQFFVTAQGDERSTDYSRGWACEIAAMRLLRKYEGKELLHVLTTDFRAFTGQEEPTRAVTTLLGSRGIWTVDTESEAETEALLPRNQRIGANSFTALEVAIIAEAKHFTSSHIVQDVLWEIWNGDIIYWRDVTSDTCKQATYYDAQEGGFWNFARLRVPRYCFFIESLNFAVLLPLYLVVVCNRQYESLGWVEIVLAVWFGGFAYQEWDQFRESGQLAFYTADPWNFFDLGMIAIYISWLLLRIVGIAKGNVEVIGYSYDILAMLALFLVPRIFRFLSLTPYFGILLPCLRRMGTDFVKFMVLVLTVTVGFMITFCIIGRDSFTVDQMAWMLVKIFFGSSYVGFDNMKQIHPILGPPLMLVFITFTNILLVTALISVLSNTFAKVMSNAREEYLFLFATTCLQSVKSDHMVILVGLHKYASELIEVEPAVQFTGPFGGPAIETIPSLESPVSETSKDCDPQSDACTICICTFRIRATVPWQQVSREPTCISSEDQTRNAHRVPGQLQGSGCSRLAYGDWSRSYIWFFCE